MLQLTYIRAHKHIMSCLIIIKSQYIILVSSFLIKHNTSTVRCLCFCILFPYIQTLYVLFSILKAKQHKKNYFRLLSICIFFCPINNDNLMVIYFSNFMQKFQRIYLFMRVWFLLRTHTHTHNILTDKYASSSAEGIYTHFSCIFHVRRTFIHIIRNILREFINNNYTRG